MRIPIALYRATVTQELPRPSVFDEGLEPGEGLIPLFGDKVEIALDFLDRLRIELEQSLALSPDAVDDANALHHAKMLRDRLPGQLRSFG
jgi:hypothetical protein